MAARVGVIAFPGSLDDRVTARALRLVGAEPVEIEHTARELSGVSALILPGGRSYGGYLRPGAIASHSPVLEAVGQAAREGLPILGIGDGFTILCEAGLLPGALQGSGRFNMTSQRYTLASAATAWTGQYLEGEQLLLPLRTDTPVFVADAAALAALEDNGRVVLRDAQGGIAGVSSPLGNVVGILPHPEYALEEGYGQDGPLGPRTSTDGERFFTSLLAALAA